jgi:hypothetical protein
MVVLGSSPTSLMPLLWWLLTAPAFLSLALLVAAVETLSSTLCRSTKEANTYISMVLFGAMGLAMWLAFRPAGDQDVWSVVPLSGHQRLLEAGFSGELPSLVQVAASVLQTELLAVVTLAAAGIVLAVTWTVFERDTAFYGG